MLWFTFFLRQLLSVLPQLLNLFLDVCCLSRCEAGISWPVNITKSYAKPSTEDWKNYLISAYEDWLEFFGLRGCLTYVAPIWSSRGINFSYKREYLQYCNDYRLDLLTLSRTGTDVKMLCQRISAQILSSSRGPSGIVLYAVESDIIFNISSSRKCFTKWNCVLRCCLKSQGYL